MSERGLSNIIHERIWAHLVAAIDGHQGIELRDEGVYREVQVGDGFRLRIKRHRAGDRISTFATPAAIEFWTQGRPTLTGQSAITLGAGYRWITDTREIGAPVISYRDGKDNPIWAVELQDPATEGDGSITWTPITDPSLPLIDLFDASQEREDRGGEQ
jgi:hypothetical protein